MSKTLSIIITALFCMVIGCARLSVQTTDWKMTATTLFKDIQIPKVQVQTPTAKITVEGYQGACQLIELQKITDSVTSMLIRAAMKQVTQ